MKYTIQITKYKLYFNTFKQYTKFEIGKEIEIHYIA